MKLGSIDFPEELVKAIRDHNLVVFAGAGVSKGSPSNLPDFKELVERISAGSVLSRTENEEFDRLLGRLNDSGVDVHSVALERLGHLSAKPNSVHLQLLRLFGGQAEVKIVTTNFDLLFEEGAKELWGQTVEVYRAPALPLGREISGIVHVHGNVTKASSLVLTDGDFGRAYLTEGWARRFLLELFQNAVVLFVGYSHGDPVMHYIARALPSEPPNNRYALDSPGMGNRWKRLGIRYIEFPQTNSDDYSSLELGITKLADLCTASIADQRVRIHAMAVSVPPHDPESEDFLRYALAKQATAHFFWEKATAPEWLPWLEKNDFLKPLFREEPLTQSQKELSHWLMRHVVIANQGAFLRLVGKNNHQLNQEFWHSLVLWVAEGAGPLPQGQLETWVGLFLETKPKHVRETHMVCLSDACGKVADILGVIKVFAELSRYNLKIGKPFKIFDAEQGESDQAIDLELPFVGSHWALNGIWEKWLKPNLVGNFVPILAVVTDCLKERHTTYRRWGKADSFINTDTWGRSAIEPHGQDNHPEAIDAIINVARDAIEHVGRTDRIRFMEWRQMLCDDAGVVLERIAVHATTESTLLSPDEKIEWLLKLGLNELGSWHETFRCLRISYAGLSVGARKAVIGAIQGHVPAVADGENIEDRTDEYRYKWFKWLFDADPSCPLVGVEVKVLQDRHPAWQQSSHPDLLHWSSMTMGIGETSPWRPEELLAKPAKEWTENLLAFRGSGEFREPSRDGMLRTLSAASERNAKWSLDLAQDLAEKGVWQGDLWPAIMNSWRRWNASLEDCKAVLTWMGRQELQVEQSREISELLLELVKDKDRDVAKDLILDARSVARSLWANLDRAAHGEGAPEDWLGEAIRQPGGRLAEFWLHCLPLLTAAGSDTDEVTRRDQFLRDVSMLLDDHTSPGDHARPIIASQFRYFIGLDEGWVRDNLTPLFHSLDSKQFKQAWDGYLVWGQLGPLSFGQLLKAFMDAIPRLGQELSHHRQRFLEYYATSTVFFWDRLPDGWIQALFAGASVADREHFAMYLRQALKDMEPEMIKLFWDGWLAKYWARRLDGIPTPVVGAETEQMLNLLPWLATSFADAVELAVRMPPGRLDHGVATWELKDSPLVTQFPEAMAKLLIFILGCEAIYGYDGVPEIVSRLGTLLAEGPLKESLNSRLLERSLGGF
jgi:hypothetical protein